MSDAVEFNKAYLILLPSDLKWGDRQHDSMGPIIVIAVIIGSVFIVREICLFLKSRSIKECSI